MKHTRYVTQAALIAAHYVVLTYLAAAMGLSSGIIQIRFSEALTILPYFMSSAVPGLFVGCILANLLTGCALWDIVFGSIATLMGAVITYLLRDKNKFLAPVAPILSNTIIVPFVLKYVYGMSGGLPYFFLTVFIGEVLSCGVLGMILLYSLEKHKKYLK